MYKKWTLSFATAGALAVAACLSGPKEVIAVLAIANFALLAYNVLFHDRVIAWAANRK